MLNRPCIVPFFSAAHAPFIQAALDGCGMPYVHLACGGREEALRFGLSSVNNDACYVALLAAGRALPAITGVAGGADAGRETIGSCEVAVMPWCVNCRSNDMEYLVRRAVEDVCPGACVSDALRGLASLEPGAQRVMAQAVAAGDLFLQARCASASFRSPNGKNAESDGDVENAMAHEVRERLAAGKGLDLSALAARIDGVLDARARACLGAVPVPVGVVGGIPVVFDAAIHSDIAGRIEAEGCRAVLPYLSVLAAYSLRAQGIECAFADELDICCASLGSSAGALRAASGSQGAERPSVCDPALAKGAGKVSDCAAPDAPDVRDARDVLAVPDARASAFVVPSVRIPCPTVEELAALGADVMPIGITGGAGWTHAAYLRYFARNGVRDLVSLGVFGCLSGHVTVKGIMRRIRELEPGLAVAMLEFDPGTSAVNQLNRLKLLTGQAKRRG